jgi:hypothetical protein
MRGGQGESKGVGEGAVPWRECRSLKGRQLGLARRSRTRRSVPNVLCSLIWVRLLPAQQTQNPSKSRRPGGIILCLCSLHACER